LSAILLEEVGSTSDWLAEHADRLPEGTWVRALRQTAGRGRQSRPWATPPGNLAASCLVHLRDTDGPATEIGFVAGVALFELACLHADRALLSLKWPNDLLLHGGKLAGILLERKGRHLVVGVGVNLAVAPVIPGRATAAFRTPPEPAAFLAALDANFAGHLARWRSDGFAPVRRAWLDAAHPAGTSLDVSGPPAVSGRFAGLGDDGALLLETDAGLLTVRAGDVMLGHPEAA
jgi:BirA family biotin operon repressor/biotin-[acetyl-CoA-carboxylase] ligase